MLANSVKPMLCCMYSIMLVDLGNGVEPMLCCMYPDFGKGVEPMLCCMYRVTLAMPVNFSNGIDPMYPDTPVTLACAIQLCCVVRTVTVGKRVEPMLCCMYPCTPVTLACASQLCSSYVVCIITLANAGLVDCSGSGYHIIL